MYAALKVLWGISMSCLFETYQSEIAGRITQLRYVHMRMWQ